MRNPQLTIAQSITEKAHALMCAKLLGLLPEAKALEVATTIFDSFTPEEWKVWIEGTGMVFGEDAKEIVSQEPFVVSDDSSIPF